MGEGTRAALGLGCWAFGRYESPGYDLEESIRTIREARRGGVSHFDTGTSYGQGYSEAVLGVALEGFAGGPDAPPLPALELASKLSCSDPQATLEEVERSRVRLRRERIDIFYIHWPRRGCSLPRMMEALETARNRGWIGAIGVSNFSTAEMEEASAGGRIDVHQTGYSLLWRHPEREVLPWCRERGIRVVTYASLAQGLLTGKFGREPELAPGDKRRELVWFDPGVWPAVHEAVREVAETARAAGTTPAAAALRWAMGRPGVDVVLAGARDRRQLRADLRAVELELPPAVLERLTAISDRVMESIPDTGNIFRYYPQR